MTDNFDQLSKKLKLQNSMLDAFDFGHKIVLSSSKILFFILVIIIQFGAIISIISSFCFEHKFILPDTIFQLADAFNHLDVSSKVFIVILLTTLKMFKIFAKSKDASK